MARALTSQNFCQDKFLIAYVLLKLGIITGKVLFFVNKVDRFFFQKFS